ncbi:MAG: dTDP-4-dehydrorhamnose reductase [Pseudomonadota bacterium]
MSILVFGAGGQVGRALAAFADVRAVGRKEADLEIPGAASALISRCRPPAIINAAAYTAVDRAEHEPDLAHRINEHAAAEMAAEAADLGIPFIHLSTDYVFDGTGEDPHQPDAPANPINAYGKSKRAGERAVLRVYPDAVILRTSWVFSETGTNFVKTMLRLSETKTMLRVVADQVGGPTAAAEIAAAAHRIAQLKMSGLGHKGLYHYSGVPETSWADFAREVFRQSGRSTLVTDMSSAEYPTPAQRPLNSRLNCQRVAEDFGIEQPDWRDGLAHVLQKLRDEAA